MAERGVGWHWRKFDNGEPEASWILVELSASANRKRSFPAMRDDKQFEGLSSDAADAATRQSPRDQFHNDIPEAFGPAATWQPMRVINSTCPADCLESVVGWTSSLYFARANRSTSNATCIKPHSVERLPVAHLQPDRQCHPARSAAVLGTRLLGIDYLSESPKWTRLT
jgi:hypothetical protein